MVRRISIGELSPQNRETDEKEFAELLSGKQKVCKRLILYSTIPALRIHVGPRQGDPHIGEYAQVQFVETEFDTKTETRLGTLVMSEENWHRWFGEKELYPQFAGKHWLSVVRELLKTPGVYIGGPQGNNFKTHNVVEAVKYYLKYDPVEREGGVE